jgi:hypothetical protein
LSLQYDDEDLAFLAKKKEVRQLASLLASAVAALFYHQAQQQLSLD